MASLNTWGTNAIEGSTITKKDAERILLGAETPGGRPMRDVLETVQHERMFKELMGQGKRELTLEFILELHDGVFKFVLPDAGSWRRVNVRIRGARYSPPRMEKVLLEMEKWVKEYRQRDLEGENVFSLGAWMHYEFERIHPFTDGNGRVGRLLLNKHFLNRNWPPVHVLPMHRDSYLSSLNQASKGDLSYLEYLLKVLAASSLLDLMDQLGTKKDKLITLKQAARSFPYSEKYLALRCKQGKIPSVMIDHRWYTSNIAVELYINNRG
jgi:Fic family protein